MSCKPKETPIRLSLKDTSPLQSRVNDGIGAIEKAHRKLLAENIRDSFADSLDLDKAMLKGHEEENRWDYLLGQSEHSKVIGLEPHSAKEDQITKVIKKKEAAREQLKGHLKKGSYVAAWLWVASSKKVHFANTERTRIRLDQEGIRFVGPRVELKHLPRAKASNSGG